MSIIPYKSGDDKSGDDILYHNPSDGVLILHDAQENSIQLVSTSTTKIQHDHSVVDSTTSSSKLDTSRFASYTIAGTGKKCPNCGFAWEDYEREKTRTKHDAAGGIPIYFKRSLPAQLSKMNEEFPKAFMHRDYFKLLAQIPHNGQEKRHLKDSNIPEGLFNQGYFKRFFRKIDPFTLGSGAHAQVYKVEHVLDNIVLGTYAVKRISIGDRYELLEQVVNEVLILNELSAKCANENNLIRYNHVWLELGDLEDSTAYFLPSAGSQEEIEKRRVPYMFILQQYCDGGHLEDLIIKNYTQEEGLSYSERVILEKKRRKSKRNGEIVEKEKRKWLSNLEIWKFIHDVATGVNYLHMHGILHRDLKPSNCLMDTKYVADTQSPIEFKNVEEFEQKLFDLPKVLVSDFGEGKFTDRHKNAGLENNTARRGNTGTLEFTAPELWLYSSDTLSNGEARNFINDFTYDSDIYSLGLILCYLCVGTLPFSNLVRGECDPQVARDKISNWYENLTLESFSDWFEEKVSSLQGYVDDCIKDFILLSYKMIKGMSSSTEEETFGPRCSSKEVLLILNDIKWKRFIMTEPMREHMKEKTQVEDLMLYQPGMNGPSYFEEQVKDLSAESRSSKKDAAEEEEEEEDLDFEKQYDSDHLDLIKEEKKNICESKNPNLFNEPSCHLHWSKIQTLPLYSLELLVLEYLSIYMPHFSQNVLKIIIYVTIGLDMVLSKYIILRYTLFVTISVTLLIVSGYTIGGLDSIEEKFRQW
ncbi:IKS1 [Candida oxycetoniae]|uniref:IKS1 n=1 Tax=Candida oxycetoniae TaxID=497107 RepID=A0AAI9WZP8_9ASCO|nr:IKS1 [Candida oxycetoniae]KAI3406428.2 IKS1 [Candida oxycetoniae]